MTFVCARCGAESRADPTTLGCPACGGPLDIPPLRLDASMLDGAGYWRYRAWLPPVEHAVTLGEPATPLLAAEWAGLDVTFKVEGSLPTGSFKDRGAAVLVSWLLDHGVTRATDDSSGNAGAALAAYCARAGVACEIYVPEAAPQAKLTQIEAYGAQLVRVRGPRASSTDAVRTAATEDAVYASHADNPLYIAGTQTFAFELWEQLGRRAPDVIVFPVGGGSLLLGAYRGFLALAAAGYVDRVPRIVGAQTAACAPLAHAVAAHSPEPRQVAPGLSVAGGILVAHPLRGREILAAVSATSGTIVAVAEQDILPVQRRLAATGIYVEPTSAVAVAALDVLVRERRIEPGETVVVALTGHGLKSPPVAW